MYERVMVSADIIEVQGVLYAFKLKFKYRFIQEKVLLTLKKRRK